LKKAVDFLLFPSSSENAMRTFAAGRRRNALLAAGEQTNTKNSAPVSQVAASYESRSEMEKPRGRARYATTHVMGIPCDASMSCSVY
jgi:hypothetical protein